MAKHWKEPYSQETALAAGVRDVEDRPVLGDPNSSWIYRVQVCGFTFTFFSLEMLEAYLDYYSRKVLPSSQGRSIWVGEPQTRFDRLPLRLREESRRQRVVRALTDALSEFSKPVSP